MLFRSMGYTDAEEQVIFIKEGLHPQRQAQTLWHETIHILLFSLGYTTHDEVMVDGLAHALQRFHECNDVTKWRVDDTPD